jgi:hypothetical protein
VAQGEGPEYKAQYYKKGKYEYVCTYIIKYMLPKRKPNSEEQIVWFNLAILEFDNVLLSIN